MINPDIDECPRCKTNLSQLILSPRTTKQKDGKIKFLGTYFHCKCYALTRSHDGVINLRNEAAEEFGIIQKVAA